MMQKSVIFYLHFAAKAVKAASTNGFLSGFQPFDLIGA
jgi:hypothetical protein